MADKDYEEDKFDEDLDEDDDFDEKDNDEKVEKKEKKAEKKEEKKEESKEEKSESKHTKKSKINAWQIAAICLGVLFLVSLYFNLNRPAGPSGADVTKVSLDTATSKAMKVINEDLLQPGMSAKLVNSSEANGLYKMTLDINGNQIPGYISPDGKLFFTNAIDLENVPAAPAEAPAADLPKSDKPVVELFVMSHCPYGTQAEKGIMPAIDALGDKVDFKIRFVNYAMHGEKEVLEQLNQYCIEKEQSAKFFPYLSCFLDKGEGAACLDKAGIDKTKLETCTKATDAEFKITELLKDEASWAGGRFPKFMIDGDLNDKYGVQGSPTLIINGVEASSGRDPASYLKTICGAFNTAPEGCSEELSAQSYSAGFGYDYATTGTGSATCG